MLAEESSAPFRRMPIEGETENDLDKLYTSDPFERET